MAAKRSSSTSLSYDEPYSKRSRPSQTMDEDTPDRSSPYHSKAPVDPTTGQRGAFPLDHEVGDAEDGLFYGPAEDGWAYLRMVRSEASTIPHLMYKPHDAPADGPRDVGSTEEQSKSRGYYSDGAYAAAPTAGPTSPHGSADARSDARERYHDLLLLRYRLLRANLACQPPADVLAAGQLPTVATGGLKNNAEWRDRLETTFPAPVQLAAMGQRTVLNLLRVVEEMVAATTGRRRGSKGRVSRRLGVWIWALLGRVGEAGTLSTEEVGVIRGVGKRAVWLAEWLGRMSLEELGLEERGAEDGQVGDTDPEGDAKAIEDSTPVPTEKPTPDDEQQQLEEAKHRALAHLPPTTDNDHDHLPNHASSAEDDLSREDGEIADDDEDEEPDAAVMHTLAVLDMVIAVVGREYGQRDLLPYGDGLWELGVGAGGGDGVLEEE